MSYFAKTFELLKQQQEEKRTALDKARKEAKDILLEKIQVVFNEFTWLNRLIVRGYTPGFNDGDVCHHSQCSVKLNSYDEDEGWDDEDEEISEVGKLLKVNYNNINNFCHLLSDTFELAFETNFEVTFTRSGNNIKMENDFYDCGY